MSTVNKVMVDNSPFNMHVRYPKEHILVVFYDSTFAKKSSSREGVFTIASAKTEGAFVTLEKCEKQFSATTMYHDYLSPLCITTMPSAQPAAPNSCQILNCFVVILKRQCTNRKGSGK
jgi:hypothetical protein